MFDATQTIVTQTIGTLQPGETFSVSIEAIRGVFAIAGTFEAHVECHFKGS